MVVVNIHDIFEIGRGLKMQEAQSLKRVALYNKLE